MDVVPHNIREKIFTYLGRDNVRRISYRLPYDTTKVDVITMWNTRQEFVVTDQIVHKKVYITRNKFDLIPI